jgi:hypothetical protein
MPAAGGKRRGGKNTGVVAKKKKTLAPPQVEWANGSYDNFSAIRYSAKAFISKEELKNHLMEQEVR